MINNKIQEIVQQQQQGLLTAVASDVSSLCTLLKQSSESTNTTNNSSKISKQHLTALHTLLTGLPIQKAFPGMQQTLNITVCEVCVCVWCVCTKLIFIFYFLCMAYVSFKPTSPGCTQVLSSPTFFFFATTATAATTLMPNSVFGAQ